MTPGERMKSRRKELGVPVEDVAAALGVSVATVYRYEKGDIEKIPAPALEPLAKVLQTSAAWLMGWNGETDPEAAYAARQREMEEALREMHFVLSDRDPQLERLMESIKVLNAQGRQQVIQYAEFLAASGEYEKK